MNYNSANYHHHSGVKRQISEKLDNKLVKSLTNTNNNNTPQEASIINLTYKDKSGGLTPDPLTNSIE